MNAGLVTLLIGVGAAAIALWIDVRFPQLAPEEIKKVLLHIAASTAVGYLTIPLIHALSAPEDPRLALLAVFGVGFPSIVYALLAGIWVMKLAQRAMSAHMR